MAIFIKGNLIPNAELYELYKKIDENNHTRIAANTTINFELSKLMLGTGKHTLVVKAKANGYEDSDYSNEVIWTNAGGMEYLHTITFESDPDASGDVETLTMTLVNDSPDSLGGDYEMEDSDVFNGATIVGYESHGVVVGHRSNDGSGNCCLELTDGTEVNSYYGHYTDTVTLYSNESVSITIIGSIYTFPKGTTWRTFFEIYNTGSYGTDTVEGEDVLHYESQPVRNSDTGDYCRLDDFIVSGQYIV